MNFLIFLLACLGMTQIITTGKIFKPVRDYFNWHFLRCAMCVGFWSGAIVFICFWLCGIQLFINLYLGTFFFGCISSAFSFAVMSLIKEDGFHINIH